MEGKRQVFFLVELFFITAAAPHTTFPGERGIPSLFGGGNPFPFSADEQNKKETNNSLPGERCVWERGGRAAFAFAFACACLDIAK